MPVRLPALALAIAVSLLAPACGERGSDEDRRAAPSTTSKDGEATTGSSATPTSDAGGASPSSTGSGAVVVEPRVRLRQIASFDSPVQVAADPSGALFVAEKTGRVRELASERVVLDLSDEVSSGNEQGLLGLTFAPAGTALYVDYTDRDGDTRVVEFPFRDGAVDVAGRREVLFVEQPFANHNGGHVAFGPDGFLYIALGDGGSGGDPQDNGQRLDTLLGKLLRIDPKPSAGSAYTIPPGNPFASGGGGRPEIWAYGLRNPWRFSFDRETGELWIGDVGQNRREEIDVVPKGQGGQNFGWNRLEGNARFKGSPPRDAVAPVFDYGRDDGACSVTAGYAYRGKAIPALRGAFVYGDFCEGSLRALLRNGARARSISIGAEVEQLASFAETGNGELLAISLEGPIYRLEAA